MKSAGQLVLVDEHFHYEADGFAKPRDARSPGPRHWLTPFDYRRGRAHIRVEVFAQPVGGPPTSILCRLCSGPHHDRAQNLRLGIGVVIFNGVGVHRYEQAVSDARPLVEPGAFRWNAPVTEVQVPVADVGGQIVSKWESDLGVFSGAMEDYLPLRVRFSAILTPAGVEFCPPDFW